MRPVEISPALFGRRWPMALTFEKGEGGGVAISGVVDAGLSKTRFSYQLPREVARDLYESLGDVLMDRR